MTYNQKLSAIAQGTVNGVLQVAQAVKTDTFSTTSTSLADVSGLSVTITPYSVNSKFLILLTMSMHSTFYTGHIALFRNSTEIGLADVAGSRPRNILFFSHPDLNSGDGPAWRESMNFLDSPATTSAITYKIQASARIDGLGGTFSINKSATDRNTTGYDGRAISSITVMEIAS